MKTYFSYLLLLAALSLFAITHTIKAHNRNLTSDEIIRATNKARLAAGLNELQIDLRLTTASVEKASDMASVQYFAHQSPRGTTPWYWLEKNRYEFLFAGENLAINYTDPKKLVASWLESPTHRNNILNPYYRNIGVGVRKTSIGDKNYTIIVQMFGAPKTVSLR